MKRYISDIEAIFILLDLSVIIEHQRISCLFKSSIEAFNARAITFGFSSEPDTGGWRAPYQ